MDCALVNGEMKPKRSVLLIFRLSYGLSYTAAHKLQHIR